MKSKVKDYYNEKDYNSRKNYKKLTGFLFSDSKKLVLLAGGVLLAALGFSLFFISINSAIVASKRQKSIETHGRFLAVFMDIDKQIADEIMEKEPMFDYRIFQVQDEMYCGGERFFSGWVTEETGKNMGIFLKEGVWPETENEVLLEEYLAHRLGICEFPQNVIFTVDGEEREYLVCGMIRNYSGSLVTSGRDLNIRKDYPSVITAQYRENAEVSLLVLQKRLNLKTSTEDIYDVTDLRSKYGISPYFSALDKYMHTCYRNTRDFERFGLVYMAAVLFLLVLVEAVIFRAVVLKNRCAERSLRELGLTKKEILLAYGLRFGKLLLETIGFQVVLGVLWGKIGGYVTGYGSLLEKQVWYTLFKQFAAIAVLLLIFAVMAWDYNTWEKTSDIRQRKNCRYFFRKINMPMLLMQAVFLVFVLFSLCMKKHFAYEEQEIRITIDAQSGGSFRYASHYAFSEAKRGYFEHKSRNPFEKYEAVLDLYMSAEMQYATLLGDKQAMPPYFARLLEMQATYGLSVFDLDAEGRWGEWEDVLEEEARRYEPLPWDTFEVLILPDLQYQQFLNENGILWEQSPAAIPECVMVLPLFAKDEEIIGVGDGSIIRVGRVFPQDGRLLFEKEEFRACKVLKELCGTEKYFSGKCLCGLVFSASQAEKSKLISGYGNIDFRLKGEVSEEWQEEIDNEIAMLAASAQGGSSFSTVEEQKDDALFEKYAAFMGTTMFAFALFAMGAFVFMHSYVRWEQNKYAYGVFRSMGMPYRTLCRKLFVQYGTGIVFACFFACYVVENIFGYPFTAGQVALCTGLLTVFHVGCYAVLYGLHKKTAICEMLREE